MTSTFNESMMFQLCDQQIAPSDYEEVPYCVLVYFTRKLGHFLL